MAYIVAKHWAVHTGRTKFYQTFEIQGQNSSVLVTHWGKLHGGKSAPNPQRYGQTKVETFSTQLGSQRAADLIRTNKTKRGYHDWTGETKTFLKESEFIEWYSTTMSSKEIESIKGLLAGDDVPSPVQPRKSKAKVEPEPERGEHWGSW